MAVINCPSCQKKISSKAKICSHCEIDLANMGSEQSKVMQTITLVQKHQKLMTHSFIAMLLFCGGFLFLFWQDALPGSWQYITSIASTIVGFIFYLITRVRLMMLKKSSK
jgi:hypothetical protein